MQTLREIFSQKITQQRHPTIVTRSYPARPYNVQHVTGARTVLEVLKVTEPEAGMPIVMNAFIDLCAPAHTRTRMWACAHTRVRLSRADGAALWIDYARMRAGAESRVMCCGRVVTKPRKRSYDCLLTEASSRS